MNKNLLNAIFLISGTAIGAGLIALPLTAVNFGVGISTAIICLAIFITYQSSMMTIDLNEANQSPASIVDLSRNLSGKKAFLISMASFYALSFSLLMVYFSGIASTLCSFFDLNNNVVVIISSLALFGVLNLKYSQFSKLNSSLVIILLAIIVTFIFQMQTVKTTKTVSYEPQINLKEIATFLPIIFTSFGVQNICSNIYEHLNKNRKQIQRAFLIGILIPALVYIAWTSSVFENIISQDVSFFEKLQNHQVSVGELIKFLCDSSNNVYMEKFFKILSLFAISTSAIGIGLGLKKSIEETITSSSCVASTVVCLIPAIVCITIPDAFIKILSFGGMIATMFVIFVPYYIKRQLGHRMGFGYNLCLVYGLLVVVCEIFQLLS